MHLLGVQSFLAWVCVCHCCCCTVGNLGSKWTFPVDGTCKCGQSQMPKQLHVRGHKHTCHNSCRTLDVDIVSICVQDRHNCCTPWPGRIALNDPDACKQSIADPLDSPDKGDSLRSSGNCEPWRRCCNSCEMGSEWLNPEIASDTL